MQQYDKVSWGFMFKQKVQAFLSHFLLSLLLMMLAGYIVFGVWYHNPYYQLFNVMPIFGLMLMIDLVLGPLLTFVVYKKGKKTLKMDLTVIVLIQAIAFGWGMWNIANARPAWIVIDKNLAYTISPVFLSNPENELNVKIPTIWEQNWLKPKYVMVPKEDNSPTIAYETEKYLPYDAKEILSNYIPIQEIDKHDKMLYQSIKSQYPQTIGYLPVITEASSDIVLLLVDDKGEIIQVILVENKLIVK